MLIFIIWFICFILFLVCILQELAFRKTESGAIHDLTGNDILKEMDAFDEVSGIWIAFICLCILSPLGLIIAGLVVIHQSIIKYLTKNKDKKLFNPLNR